MTFKFYIGQQVKVAISGEAGEVRGRAEYTASERSYLVLYKSADGRAVETWWPESVLVEA